MARGASPDRSLHRGASTHHSRHGGPFEETALSATRHASSPHAGVCSPRYRVSRCNEDRHARQKTSSIAALLAADLQQHAFTGAPIVKRHCEVKNQPASGSKAVEPDSSRVGYASVNEDRVARTGIISAALAMHYIDVYEVFEILTCATGEVGVNLDAENVTSWPDDLRHDRRVVADTTSHMNNGVPLVQFEGLNTESQIARLPIVQVSVRIDRDEHVTVQMHGVICRGDFVIVCVGIGIQNVPGAWAEKCLARNGRKRCNQGVRRETRGSPHCLGVAPANALEGVHTAIYAGCW